MDHGSEITSETIFEHSASDGDTMGGRICRARDALGLSTAQVARRLGVKSTTLAGWELDRSEPRSNKLVMLAGVLNVSPSWLLTGLGESPTPDLNNGQLESMRQQLEVMRDQMRSLTEQMDQMVERLESFGHFEDQ